MTAIVEASQWDSVTQIETTTPVLGGLDGPVNVPLKNLANRTKYLKDQVTAMGVTGLSNVAPVVNGVAAVGTSTLAARQDHVHPTDTGRAAVGQTFYLGTTQMAINRASATQDIAGLGVVTGTSFNAITGLASVAPVVDGTAAVGTSTLAARQDHAHPTDTGRAAVGQTFYLGTTQMAINRASATQDVAGLGVVTGTSFNAITGLASVAPSADSTAASVGSSTTAARADHVHAVTTTLFNTLGVNLGQSVAASGYQKLPGGLIVQWGSATAATSGADNTISFPTTFPNACLAVVATPMWAQSSVTATDYITSKSTSSFVWHNMTGGSTTVMYIAIGY